MLARSPQPAPRLIILQQGSPSWDRDAAWMAELKNDLLLEELAERMARVQRLLGAIAASTDTWAFVSGHSCYGTLWELAAACHYRIWLSEDASIGLPPLPSQPPPASFTLGTNRLSLSLREMSQWGEAPRLTTKAALRRGWINFLGCGSRDPLGMASQWLRQQVPAASLRHSMDAHREPLGPLLPFATVLASEQRWLAAKKLGDDPWTYGLSLLKAQRQFSNYNEYVSLTLYHLARYYLSAGYLLAQEQLTLPLANPPLRLKPSLPRTPLCFDVNLAPPPVSMVEALLSSDQPVVFFAAQSKELATCLEQLYLKLERRFSGSSLQGKWHRLISWYVGPCSRPQALVVRCEPNDQVLLTTEGESLSFLNLQGNQLSSPLGLWELLSPTPLPLRPLPPQLTILTLGMTSAAPPPGRDAPSPASPEGSSPYPGMPASTWIRCHFLDEMLRISRGFGGDLPKLAAGLEAKAWGFAGSPLLWTRFLQHRSSNFSSSNFSSNLAKPSPLAAYPPERERLGLSSWKAACQAAEGQRSKEAQPWHATGASIHLALYAAALAAYLQACHYLDSPGAASLLVCKALEMPPSYGSPLEFAQRWGQKRFHAYCRHHWPLLSQQLRVVGSGAQGIPSHEL